MDTLLAKQNQFDPNFVWKQSCGIIKNKVSPAVFNTWILANPLSSIERTDRGVVAIITCPTAFHATNLERNLHNQLQDTFEEVVGEEVVVNYKVGIVQPPPNFNKSPDNQLDKIIQTNGFASPSVEQLFSEQTLKEATEDQAVWKARQVGLRPEFTFETFAVSTTNEMAHAAAVAVSKQPGLSYNPLFFYGGVGVGKTHLMHAIGNNILHNHPDTDIIYCTGEEFTNQIVQAIRNKQAAGFKNKFRSAQVLLIDDIQFIAGKNAVQEEFFHTFNALTKNMSQIVLNSDRPPQEISLLEDRLRSRFEAGLMIDIAQPTFELRTAILLVKAKAVGAPLTIDLAKQVASQITSARRLEGFINKLRSEVELKNQEFSPELIERLLMVEENNGKVRVTTSPGEVIKIVADVYGFKQTAIRGKRRVKQLVEARHLAMYILKFDLSLALVEIGRWFSNRDHTSVIHATRKISHDLEKSPHLNERLAKIRSQLTTA